MVKDFARWRCLVPFCTFRSDALTDRSFEADRKRHAIEASGHAVLVRTNYKLPSRVVDLLACLRLGTPYSDFPPVTIKVALRLNLVVHADENRLERTSLGCIVEAARLSQKAA